MKSTLYFQFARTRQDRTMIQDERIERAIQNPIREHVQADGRMGSIHADGCRYLKCRVVSFASFCFRMVKRFTTLLLTEGLPHEDSLFCRYRYVAHRISRGEGCRDAIWTRTRFSKSMRTATFARSRWSMHPNTSASRSSRTNQLQHDRGTACRNNSP